MFDRQRYRVSADVEGRSSAVVVVCMHFRLLLNFREISSLLDDLQEFMPMNENSQVEGYTYEEVFGRRSRRRRRNSWCDFQSLCCTKSLS